MTSKEAYYILIQAWHGNKDTYDYPSFDDINEAFDVLKQNLERLERLQQELKVCEYFERNLIQQNEKLKNEKEQIKKWIVDKIKYLDKGVFLMSGERVKGAIEILNELLKEVLGNEMV